MTTGDSYIRVNIQDPNESYSVGLLKSATEELAMRYPEEGAHELLPDRINEAGGVFVVAWMNDIPAGCGALRAREPDVAEVKRMFVAPFARRRGIGRLILASLEVHARGLGYMLIRLETGIRQPEAIRLYESVGYRQSDCYGEYINKTTSVCFEKALC